MPGVILTGPNNSNSRMTDFVPFKIFTPSGIFGYGYNLDQFWEVINHDAPAAIILDAGSTDPGPYMLGTGKNLCSKQSIVRDLTPILKAASKYGIKVMISSVGGAGTNEQVDQLSQTIREVTESHSWQFRVATIKFKDDRAVIADKFHTSKIRPCSSSPELLQSDIDEATVVVAQMGAEPFLEALKTDADIIISGRSYDPAPFAAYCMHRGVEPSPAWHVGKIIECGGLCTVPKGRSIIATMLKDSFILTPVDSAQRCTPLSVAAHTLYEKTRPDKLPGPGGVLHLDACTYTQLEDDRSIHVKHSRFVPTPNYEIKLEGVTPIGYRTVYIGGIRDPILIAGIDPFLERVQERTKEAFPELGQPAGPRLIFHVYGKNAVMGHMEPETSTTSHEIGVLGEVLGQSQEVADAIAGFSRTVLLHGEYDGQVATAGNLALPLTPLETSLGPVFKFSFYHLMEVDDPCDMFVASSFLAGDGAREPTSKPSASRPLHALQPLQQGIQPDLTTVISSSKMTECLVSDIASVIRSKNSGPFEITLDIMFTSAANFHRAKESNVLVSSLIEKLYHLKPDDIVTCMFFEPALAWKCTFKRPWAQGSVGERDTFGTQMHAPLMSVKISEA